MPNPARVRAGDVFPHRTWRFVIPMIGYRLAKTGYARLAIAKAKKVVPIGLIQH
jgi:hypothetical protein